MSAAALSLDIASLQAAYRGGTLTPLDVVDRVLQRIAAYPDPAVWISRAPAETLRAAARTLLEVGPRPGQPLWGIPFAVKDNIDCAGFDTTAACPEFAYRPDEDAAIVARLRAAGALLVGKTNLDQFATGLNGTRSPYGAPRCVYNRDYISGGSSSGSAVAVAAGLVSFALGTDTAGSGRVPAAFNNIVGLKPTRGWFSTRGVVPACRSLDCASVMALKVDDAWRVAEVVGGFDAADPYSRQVPAVSVSAGGAVRRLGVPSAPEFFGDALAQRAYVAACDAARAQGIELVPIDFAPLHEAAALLYDGPWVAERFVAVESFWRQCADAMHPVVRGIIAGGQRFSAADGFRAEYRLRVLKRRAAELMASVDALLVPSAPTTYTVAEMEADPLRLNSRLGLYTNFVNLLDWSALALPAGWRDDGLPFGVTVIGPAWADRRLAEFGRVWLREPAVPGSAAAPAGGTLLLAVVGAHLRGMPLNHELTARGAVFVETARTSADYRLYALQGTVPPKPGLAKVGNGASIEVELWELPLAAFGSFMAGIAAPLGIGTLSLSDGREVKGFICEPQALIGARDITEYAGWRAYRAATSVPS